jgi:hypothetical protein
MLRLLLPEVLPLLVMVNVHGACQRLPCKFPSSCYHCQHHRCWQVTLNLLRRQEHALPACALSSCRTCHL